MTEELRTPLKVAIDARHAGQGLGIATFVFELTAVLAHDASLEIHWLGPATAAPPGVHVVTRVGRWPYPMLDLEPGKRLIAALGIDVVHFTGNTGWTRPGPVPFVLTLHDVLFMVRGQGRPRQRLGHAYTRAVVPRAIRSADALTTVSRASRCEIKQSLSPRRDVHVIPHGAPVSPTADKQRPWSARASQVVGFSGRDPRKGTRMLLDVLRELGNDGPRLALATRGGLPPGFTDDAAAELASGRIILHPSLSRQELDDLVGESLALLYPSTAEGFGLPVLEAMALGTPVVTGLCPSTLEVGGGAVLAIDEENPIRSMAECVRWLAHDREHFSRVVEAGHQQAHSHSWTCAGRTFAELYRSVAAGAT